MSWAEDYRLAWIAEMLTVYGFINREHLITKFRISGHQASKDLRKFQADNPKSVRYDGNAKRYVRV